MRISIASTFTCNPIENALKFWGERFGYNVAINLSPYDQVFQELLDMDSTLNHPENDARILFVRFEDWIRNLWNTDDSSLHTHIVENIHYLSTYAQTSSSHSTAPLFLMIAKNSIDSLIKPGKQSEYEQLLSNRLSGSPDIYVITSREIDMKYPVDDYHDPERDRLAHIPFTSKYFTALATAVFRNILTSKRKPHKVIVLDCDNTLWSGVCGEVGAKGINLSEPYINLQLFMLQQIRSGKILCLCSKNVPADVDSVFSERPDMILRGEDIVSAKINWQPKFQNIKELSEELNLGIDSFIFVDDNPVECAEMRANCPEVFTLNLPGKAEEIIPFLDHVWPFDFLKSTHEDQKRTKLYKDNIKRTNFKNTSSSLKEFMEGLNLDISIKDAEPDEMDRVSQLTYRTNQFNFTTIRRSERDINELIRTGGFECKVCKVSDRFGDYGLVGVMLYQKLSDRIVLDSFMLSCRVLGRGVEYKMLRSVGEEAVQNGLDLVQIKFNKTEKNLPARNFLQSIIEDFSGDVQSAIDEYIMPSVYLGGLIYNPKKNIAVEAIASGRPTTSTPKASEENKYQIFEQIAKELNSAIKINQLVHPESGDPVPIELPGERKNTLQIITEIWESVLGKTGIGSDQHFFDMGGTSLKAVEVLSQLNERFNKNLTIVSLFEHSTILSLAKLVEGNTNGKEVFSKIIKRAEFRRDRFRRRN